ncbi:MAG: Verru_Chthon cassette protein D [Chthoniobacterales bacterium]
MSAPLIQSTREGKSKGFTVVELLAVVAIMVLMFALIVPAFHGISNGVNITATGEQISTTVGLARQRATTFNRNVAIRFYRQNYSDKVAVPFKSYQLWEQADLSSSNWTAVDSEQTLGAGIIIDADVAKFSPILDLSKATDTKGHPFSAVLFTPSGSITAPFAQAFLTIHAENAPKNGGSVAGLPANYSVVAIEPFNGRARVFRP